MNAIYIYFDPHSKHIYIPQTQFEMDMLIKQGCIFICGIRNNVVNILCETKVQHPEINVSLLVQEVLVTTFGKDLPL